MIKLSRWIDLGSRKEIEIAKTIICWVSVSIIVLLMVFYDNWRMKVDRKAEEMIGRMIQTLREEIKIEEKRHLDDFHKTIPEHKKFKKEKQ